LENSFGRKVLSSRDCLQLVEDIRQKTGYSVNSNTLRRFFGLVPTQYNPSPSTISIFLKYCGFDSLEDLSRIRTIPKEEMSTSVDSVMHFLIGLFRHMPVTEGHNPTAEAVVEQTALFLEGNPGIVDRFHREVSRTEAGRYYYFEMSVKMAYFTIYRRAQQTNLGYLRIPFRYYGTGWPMNRINWKSICKPWAN
jgi:hypothetical protein